MATGASGQRAAGRLHVSDRPTSGSLDGIVVGLGNLDAHGRRGQRGPGITRESELCVESVTQPVRIIDR